MIRFIKERSLKENIGNNLFVITLDRFSDDCMTRLFPSYKHNINNYLYIYFSINN